MTTTTVRPASGGRTSTRMPEMDALRGLIMILMMIDHAAMFLAREHASEYWAGAMTVHNSALPFVTRLVTHLCAPGFFFLMGSGLVWLYQSREAAGWDQSRILRRIGSRGLVLFAVGQLIENPPMIFAALGLKEPAVHLSQTRDALPSDGTGVMWPVLVMSALGLVMMASALLLRFGPALWAAVAIACAVLTANFLPVSGVPLPLPLGILLTPGVRSHVMIQYAVLPWLGVTSLGLLFGYWWKKDPRAGQRVLWLGLGMLALACALRATGIWGNIRLPRDGGWIEFLNMVKYPPAPVFWMFFLGVDLVLLAALRAAPASWLGKDSPLIVFGQAPLFYYLAHLYLLAIIGGTIFRVPASLEVAYAAWATMLLVLYPLCRWYRDFKMSKPAESVWRLF